MVECAGFGAGQIGLTIIALAAGMGLSRMYLNEIRRRSAFKKTLETYISQESVEGYTDPDKQIGDLASLIRVYEDKVKGGYKTELGKHVELEPIKTVPLNFHWGWGYGSTLKAGLKTHITDEGIKAGADAYFLSHSVSGHGNPMYALSFFRYRIDEKQNYI